MKKLEKKPLIICVCMILIQSVSYLFVKLLQGQTHLIGSTLDNSIPFINYFIIFYCLWYVLLFFVPYYLYIKDKNMFTKYIISYTLAVFISSIIFIIYPTEVIRPLLNNNNLLDIITNLIYKVDTPAINCLPSMHCAICTLFIISLSISKKSNNVIKIIINIMSILIMLSTLFVKQHVIIDALTGIVMMSIIFIYVNYNNRIVNKVKKLLNI